MTPRDAHTLLDILNAGRLISQYLDKVNDAQQLKEDSILSSAFAWQFHILGEATKRLPEETRAAYPSVPWRDMARMRDRIAHGYDAIDWTIVWRVATTELPKIVAEIDRILRETGTAPRR